jgi:hypothetical protein
MGVKADRKQSGKSRSGFTIRKIRMTKSSGGSAPPGDFV